MDFRFLLMLIAFALSGCQSSQPTVLDEPNPPLEVAPVQRLFSEEFKLTAVGSAQVGGTYVHPGQSVPVAEDNKNCVSIEIEGSQVVSANATASWSDGGELVLFRTVRDYSDESRGHQHAIGTSPLELNTTLPADETANWLFFGIQAGPDGPASAGTQDDISLRVEINYVGESAPSLVAYDGCSYQLA